MTKNERKNIVVFGASGKTGHQLVRYALEKGYPVTAALRDKSRLKLKYHNLNILRCDVRSKKEVDRAIKNQDIVVSSLGSKPGQSPVCREGMENILEAMKKFRVRKLIALSAYGARETNSGFYGRSLNYLLKKIMQDKNEMEAIIEKSRMDWMVIRPVILTNGKFTDKYNLATEGTIPGMHFISREDVARFIVDSLGKKNYKHKFITIYS